MKLRLGFVASSVAALLLVCAVGGAFAAPMILNEYNGVKDANVLKNDGSDTYFGIVAGNGGDWMELVAIQDQLDLTGWWITTLQSGSTDATIELPSLTLRSGSILTIAENVADDFSYNPVAGDWWINYQASFSSGDSSHNDFQVMIYDAAGNLVFGPSGEGIIADLGVGSDEVYKLEDTPSDSITPMSNYNDGSSSTFGAPNQWSSGTITQDFSALRAAVVPEPASILALACGIVPLVIRRRSAK